MNYTLTFDENSKITISAKGYDIINTHLVFYNIIDGVKTTVATTIIKTIKTIDEQRSLTEEWAHLDMINEHYDVMMKTMRMKNLSDNDKEWALSRFLLN